MKVEKVFWFNGGAGMPLIGIVFGKDEVTGKAKAYIGQGRGIVEEDDIKLIKDWGAKFRPTDDVMQMLLEIKMSEVEEGMGR